MASSSRASNLLRRVRIGNIAQVIERRVTGCAETNDCKVASSRILHVAAGDTVTESETIACHQTLNRCARPNRGGRTSVPYVQGGSQVIPRGSTGVGKDELWRGSLTASGWRRSLLNDVLENSSGKGGCAAGSVGRQTAVPQGVAHGAGQGIGVSRRAVWSAEAFLPSALQGMHSETMGGPLTSSIRRLSVLRQQQHDQGQATSVSAGPSGPTQAAAGPKSTADKTSTPDGKSSGSDDRISAKAGEATGEGQSQQGGDDEKGGSNSGRRTIRSGPVSWGSLALLMLTGGGILAYYDREKRRRLVEVKQGPAVGKPAIGGPFTLLNQDGKRVSEKDFQDGDVFKVFYFGFTYCPDICPEELKKLAEAVDVIEKKAKIKITPVFVSVDAERDTVEQVRDYVKEFHPRMIGLTGTPEEVKQMAKAYRVYYMKTDESDDTYMIDHSIVMYLMDPNMDFVKFFGKNYTTEELANGIIKEIKARQSQKQKQK